MVRQTIEGTAPALALVDQAGRPLTLHALRGKVVLLTFIYSTCADVCPLMTAAMIAMQHRLTAAERERIFFLSVTLDPEVDTPEVLGAYAHRHGADLTSWAFLTGSLQAMQEVWQSFGLSIQRRAAGVVDHPSWTLLLDREGLVRYRYLGSLLEGEVVLADMRSLVEEP
ncbi:MAG TPA: SCO family protein [Candidatus Saccharimonadia bacterium]|nr:SCO family protein [Candidatus Saccharimonadia bacterium]